MNGGRAIAAAIAIAGASIGLGLYFGLRDRRVPSAPPPAAPPALPAAAPSDPAAARAQAERFTLALLEHHRADLSSRCGASDASPSPVRLTLDITYGPDGAQIARGFSEQRGRSRPGAASCAQDALPPLRIPPQGTAVRVEILFEIP